MSPIAKMATTSIGTNNLALETQAPHAVHPTRRAQLAVPARKTNATTVRANAQAVKSSITTATTASSLLVQAFQAYMKEHCSQVAGITRT